MKSKGVTILKGKVSGSDIHKRTLLLDTFNKSLTVYYFIVLFVTYGLSVSNHKRGQGRLTDKFVFPFNLYTSEKSKTHR